MTMDTDDFECIADLLHGYWSEAMQPVRAELAALRGGPRPWNPEAAAVPLMKRASTQHSRI